MGSFSASPWWFGCRPSEGLCRSRWGPGIAFTPDAAGGRILPLLRNVSCSGGDQLWLALVVRRLVAGDPGRKVMLRALRPLCARGAETFYSPTRHGPLDAEIAGAFLAKVEASCAISNGAAALTPVAQQPGLVALQSRSLTASRLSPLRLPWPGERHLGDAAPIEMDVERHQGQPLAGDGPSSCASPGDGRGACGRASARLKRWRRIFRDVGVIRTARRLVGAKDSPMLALPSRSASPRSEQHDAASIGPR